jgi:hypothetical protein
MGPIWHPLGRFSAWSGSVSPPVSPTSGTPDEPPRRRLSTHPMPGMRSGSPRFVEAQTEGMSGWIGVDLEGVRPVEFEDIKGLEHFCPERHHLFVRFFKVLHPEINVDLLRHSIGPLRLLMIGSKLDAYLRLAVHEDHVPIVFDIDGSLEHAGPEGALWSEIGSVEDNDVVLDLHGPPFPILVQ